MKLFLTSTLGGSYRDGDRKRACRLRDDNGLIERLKEDWPELPRCLLFSAGPDDWDFNDEMRAMYAEAFRLSDLPFSGFDLCDSRNGGSIGEMLGEYQVLILSGGSVPEENDFFREIRLKEWLKDYRGIVITISAGSMNSAESVYMIPELEDMPVVSQADRYLEGLALTGISIVPHFQRREEYDLGRQICKHGEYTRLGVL